MTDVAARTQLPLSTSPIRKARDKLGLTLNEVAEKAEVNYQTWYLTECACYSDIPPTILFFLEDAGFNLSWVEREYTLYITRARNEFFLEYFRWYEVFLFSGKEHPVVELREHVGLSRQAFAKELCVQPAILYKCEKGLTKKLPQQLRKALQDVYLPDTVLEELQRILPRWYRGTKF